MEVHKCDAISRTTELKRFIPRRDKSSLCLVFLEANNKASSCSLVILLRFCLVTGVD